jgi:hypothetical protein
MIVSWPAVKCNKKKAMLVHKRKEKLISYPRRSWEIFAEEN